MKADLTNWVKVKQYIHYKQTTSTVRTPAGIYLFKVNNMWIKMWNMHKVNNKKTPEQRRRRSGVFVDNFEHT